MLNDALLPALLYNKHMIMAWVMWDFFMDTIVANVRIQLSISTFIMFQ